MALDDNAGRAEERIDAFLENYYGEPAATMRRRQATFAGPPAAAAAWLRRYSEAGASDVILRFAGDQERSLQAVAALRAPLGW